SHGLVGSEMCIRDRSNIIENMEQFSSYKKERCNEIVSPMQYSIKDKVIQKIAWRLNIVL
ncbi:hypothetical protein LPH68_25760, partial [Bacteroides sp. 1_1_30]|nr:hypothetical protein [Bacteroides sp. 1_1_30]